MLEICNHRLLQRTVQSILALSESRAPLEPYVLYDDCKPLAADRLLTVITDPFHMDFNSKKMQARIINRLQENLSQDISRYTQWQRALDEAIDLVRESSQSMQAPINIPGEIQFDDFCKALNVQIASDPNAELCAQMLKALDIAGEWLQDQVVVCFSLLHYYSQAQRDELFRYAAYIKVRFLLVEPKLELAVGKNETRWLIHEDFTDEILKG